MYQDFKNLDGFTQKVFVNLHILGYAAYFSNSLSLQDSFSLITNPLRLVGDEDYNLVELSVTA